MLNLINYIAEYDSLKKEFVKKAFAIIKLFKKGDLNQNLSNLIIYSVLKDVVTNNNCITDKARNHVFNLSIKKLNTCDIDLAPNTDVIKINQYSIITENNIPVVDENLNLIIQE